MEFTVMLQDEPVAVVKLSEDKKKVEIHKLVPDSIRQPFSGSKLAQAGLTHNNPWEWVKLTHGVTYEDLFWVRFPGETLTWKDVRVR